MAPQVCVGAIVMSAGKLLLVRRGHGPASGEWSIPGGRVEHGELVAEAVVRELREETGLEAVCGEFLGWVERLTDDGHFVILDHQAEVLTDREPIAGDDATEVAWIDLDDVAGLDLVDGLAEFLHDHGIIRTYV